MSGTWPRPLWRNRDFVLLCGGQAVSALGTQVSSLALPLLVLATLHSPTQAGLIAAARSVPYLVVGLPAGALVDRWNRKAVMIVCDLIRWLAFGSIPVAYVLHQLSIGQLYVVAVVDGITFVFFNLAEVAALPRVVPVPQLPHANAMNASADAAASLLGPGLAGMIISLAGATVGGAALAYLVDSLSYLASVLSLSALRISLQQTRATSTRRSLRTEIVDGLRFLGAERRVRIMALLAMNNSIFFSPVYLALIVLARDHLQADARAIGLIFSTASLGGLLGAVIAPWVKTRLRFGQVIIGTVIMEAFAVGLLAIATTPFMLVAGWGLANLAFPIYSVTNLSYRLLVVPDVFQGRVNSTVRLMAFSSIAIGTAAGGVLLGPLGPRTELWIIATGLALGAGMVSLTEIRRA